MLFLATEPLTDAITMAQGNSYTFRVRPSTYMQTKMLVDAVKAKGVKKWAIVAPNYEYGQSAAANFKKLIKAATPEAEIVAEQFPALGKIDAGATVAALENSQARRHLQRAVRRRPHGVRARGQHARPVREAHGREPADRRARIHHPARRGDAGGLDRHRLSLGADHRRPRTRPSSTPTSAKFNDTPRLGSLLGYVVGYMMRDLLDKAGSTDTEKLIAALEDMQVRHHRRPGDDARPRHQSTLGAWVGETTTQGQGRHHEELDVRGRRRSIMFPEAEVKAARKE